MLPEQRVRTTASHTPDSRGSTHDGRACLSALWVRVWDPACIRGYSMILAECIFSQSATGEVSSAYFRKLAISPGGESANFRKRAENARLCRNTLTVQTCGPHPSTSKKPAIREVAGRRAVQKPGSLWLCRSDFMLPHTVGRATGRTRLFRSL